ncbi:MAG: hypothetical protein J7521_22435 [Caulobacter sp.]|nr:hypothetical protein [Caulobacter sp.]
MIVMAICAVLGAALGLYVKPRWLGVAIAVGLAAAVEGGVLMVVGLIDDQPNRDLLIERLQDVFGTGLIGSVPPVAAALAGGVLAAALGGLTDKDRPAAVVTADGIRRKVGKDGRYARMEGMVEERPARKAAESRFESTLGL